MQVTFKCVTDEYSELFHVLMKDYARELDEHQNRITEPTALSKWTDNIISKSKNNAFRILKLCYISNKVIGFLIAKIDKSDDKGFRKDGYGYIMEFYVLPEYRRKGYGRQMYFHLEEFFKANRVKKMYLTADPIIGKPFWESLGFISTGEISPENNQAVYEKNITTISI